MKLIDDWRRLFPKLWSVRFTLLALLFGALELLCQLLVQIYPGFLFQFWFGIAALVFNMLAMFARMVKQPNLWGEDGQ
jgi:hypothetical protein